jgi:hypothetical protein
MIFPCVELKFSQIRRSAGATTLLVRLYRLDDGGLNERGDQINLRTLLRARVVSVDAGVTKAQVLALAREKLIVWAIEEGYDLTSDRVICTL